MNKLTLKNPALVSAAAMFALLVLDICLYRERVRFGDAAFQLFREINRGTPEMPGNRYGAFVVQVLPYIARALHAPVGVAAGNHHAICYGQGSSYNHVYVHKAGTKGNCQFSEEPTDDL